MTRAELVAIALRGIAARRQVEFYAAFGGGSAEGRREAEIVVDALIEAGQLTVEEERAKC